jgi:uncharacterized protein YjbJ (UPF0337 family)
VSIAKKIAHRLEAQRQLQEGNGPHNRRLRVEGRASQATGDVKQVGAKVKDAFFRH